MWEGKEGGREEVIERFPSCMLSLFSFTKSNLTLGPGSTDFVTG